MIRAFWLFKIGENTIEKLIEHSFKMKYYLQFSTEHFDACLFKMFVFRVFWQMLLLLILAIVQLKRLNGWRGIHWRIQQLRIRKLERGQLGKHKLQHMLGRQL